VSNISSMADIQNLFKETIAEFMENNLDAELDDELGYSTTIQPVRRTFPNSTIYIVSNTWEGSFLPCGQNPLTSHAVGEALCCLGLQKAA